MIDFIARVVGTLIGVFLACILLKLFDLAKENTVKFVKYLKSLDEA